MTGCSPLPVLGRRAKVTLDEEPSVVIKLSRDQLVKILRLVCERKDIIVNNR